MPRLRSIARPHPRAHPGSADARAAETLRRNQRPARRRDEQRALISFDVGPTIIYFPESPSGRGSPLPDIFLCKRVSAASGSERAFRKGLTDGASLDTARGADSEVVRTGQNIFLIAYLNMEEIPGLLRPMSVNGI